MPETSLKVTPAQVFSSEFYEIFHKILSEHPLMTATADSSYLLITLFFSFFPSLFSFYPFIIDNCNYGRLFRNVIKMNIFLFLFTITYPKLNMLFRQFCIAGAH